MLIISELCLIGPFLHFLLQILHCCSARTQFEMVVIEFVISLGVFLCTQHIVQKQILVTDKIVPAGTWLLLWCQINAGRDERNKCQNEVVISGQRVRPLGCELYFILGVLRQPVSAWRALIMWPFPHQEQIKGKYQWWWLIYEKLTVCKAPCAAMHRKSIAIFHYNTRGLLPQKKTALFFEQN